MRAKTSGGGWNLPLGLANHNAPEQVVLSGTRMAIQEAAERLSAERITTRPLTVATAFHSPLVAEAAPLFRRQLLDVAFAAFDVPVYSNVTAAPYPDDLHEIQEQLASAVAKPVRFVEMIEAMYAREAA